LREKCYDVVLGGQKVEIACGTADLADEGFAVLRAELEVEVAFSWQGLEAPLDGKIVSQPMTNLVLGKVGFLSCIGHRI
jgi:hypothetical protein